MADKNLENDLSGYVILGSIVIATLGGIAYWYMNKTDEENNKEENSSSKLLEEPTVPVEVRNKIIIHFRTINKEERIKRRRMKLMRKKLSKVLQR
jgi:hypothetical protein